MKTFFILQGIVFLLALIVGSYILLVSPWRYCPRCCRYWHRKTWAQQDQIPEEAEGVCKSEVCPGCE